jgi:two-component system, chemotaxis family, CheB/CheR fusion protein
LETVFAEYLTHAPVFVKRTDGEIVYWTTGAEELYGYSLEEAVGHKEHDLLHTKFPMPLSEIQRALGSDGVWHGVVQQSKADGARLWVDSRWRLRRTRDGLEDLIIVSNSDITQRENLARELDHRVRNTLSIVQGLARMTLRNGGPESVSDFEKRLSALASAHAVLLDHHWRSAGLVEVLNRALIPLGIRERVTLDGQDTELHPNSIISYVLAFHELGTNALKHGSLSVSQGGVDVTWRLYAEHGERLHLIWRERGGPEPKAQPSSNSGMRLLQRVVAADLGTPINLRFESAGLVCEFDGPTQKEPDMIERSASD